MDDLINIIQKHSLTVRCLPHKVVNHWSYKEGDENKKYVDSKGNAIKSKRTLVIQKFDLEYFEKTPPQEWDKKLTPKERLKRFLRTNPTGERKLIKEEKTVEHGGWWYVKETKNTDSTIRFNRKYDKFFAPTLKEAIQLYLNSKE
jgi:hypothetical protein